MRAVALILGLLATPAVAADQFDLVCTGKQRILPSRKWEPYQVRYRVDLARMIYCRFDCKATESIASADAARITFQLPASDRPATYVSHYVDRSDGHWQYYLAGDSETEGKCEPAPFSGLPAQKF
jgi:hypothetical protein